MASFTFTFAGDTQSEGDLRQLCEIVAALSKPEDPIVAAAKEIGAHWTALERTPSKQEFERYWQLLQPNARRILNEIATRPTGYPASELRAELNMSGQQIGGMLSSAGAAHRRAFTDPEKVWVWSYDGTYYYMDDEVAERIRSFYSHDMTSRLLGKQQSSPGTEPEDPS